MIKNQTFIKNSSKWWLIGALASLLLVLWAEKIDGASRFFFFSHLGFFMLWLPTPKEELRWNKKGLVLSALLVLAVGWWMNWTLLVMWLILLSGIIGSRVTSNEDQRHRVFYLCAFAFLTISLVAMALPRLLPASDHHQTIFLTAGRYTLPSLLLLMFMIPVRKAADQRDILDLAYGLLMVLLLAALSLLGLLIVALSSISYGEAVLYSLIIMTAVLLLLGWLWSPQAGFAGMQMLFSRYLLSIGLPMSQWLELLGVQLQQEEDPQQFMDIIGRDFIQQVPWLCGLQWRNKNEHGFYGMQGRQFVIDLGEMQMVFYSHQPLSTIQQWQLNLMAQILVQSYRAKVHGQLLRQSAYMQAIHETGARLAHDIKNILQTINLMCESLQLGEDEDPEGIRQQVLVREQLPLIAQRLQRAIDKLQSVQPHENVMGSVKLWWQLLQRRYGQGAIQFVQEGVDGQFEQQGPVAIFDMTIDNLLQNALEKRKMDASVQITVGLVGTPLQLWVEDSGQPLMPKVATALFDRPVPSGHGLGVGLYQSAQYARRYGFKLALAENQQGKVKFILTPADDLGSAKGAVA